MGDLSEQRTLDAILATVMSVDTAALKQVSKDWSKVIDAIGAGRGDFDQLVGKLSNHWKGKAFNTYQASADQASTGMKAWETRGPERAKHIDRVVEIVEYMQWLLWQKQKNERNIYESNLDRTLRYAQEVVSWWESQPTPKPVITQDQLDAATYKEEMQGINGKSENLEAYFLVVRFRRPQVPPGAYDLAHKQLFDFYDEVARDVANTYGGQIKQLANWDSPPPYIGLGNVAPPKPDGGTPENPGGGAQPPGGGGGGGGVSKPGGGPQTKQPNLEHRLQPIDQQPKPDTNPTNTQPPDGQSPNGQPPDGQPPTGEQQPPGQPDGGESVPPPSIPPVAQPPVGVPPVIPPILPPGSRPALIPPGGSGRDPVGAGAAGGALRGGGAGASGGQGISGRMAEGGNVLSGRAGGAGGNAGAVPPMYPPMAPGAGAGAGGGGYGGRTARPRRPIPLGGPRVLGEEQAGQGRPLSGRSADRKKAAPPRQQEEQLTGWEMPVEQETAEQQRPQQTEHRYGI